jgi:hypothetical protein
MELLIAILVLSTFALIAMIVVIRRVGSAGRDLPVTAEWIADLSIERYRPMLRLLDAEDIEFLRSQPGYNPRMASRLRVQRARIFSGYLRCLSNDFSRICAALNLVMAQSRHDRPELAAVLMRQKATFAYGIISAYGRLALYRWGLCSVDVTSLVSCFDGMCQELRQLVPAASPMSA